MLAQLNHSNIAATYGVEEAAGRYALVMELVVGPTLEDRIGTALPPARQNFDLAPDGQRFAVMMAADETGEQEAPRQVILY